MLEQCRICLKEGNLFVKIFGESQSSALRVKMMALANVQVNPDDGLPSTICRKCIKEIDECTNFIQLIKESDQKLRALRGYQIKEEPFSEIEFLSDSEVNSDLDEKIIKIKEEEITESLNDEEDTKSDGNDTIIEVEDTNSEVKDTNIQVQDTKSEVKKIIKKYCKKSVKCQCNFCGKIFSSQYHFKTHMSNHTGEGRLSCSHCSKTFPSKSSLNRHLKIHTGEKPYKCMECNAVFGSKYNLFIHKRILHSGDSPHQCHLCKKMCHTASHLRCHLKQHTGEKNFVCDSCGMAFIDRSHLRGHMIRHSSEKPHMCSICGLRIARKSTLKRHIQNVHNKQKKKCNKKSGENGERKGKVGNNKQKKKCNKKSGENGEGKGKVGKYAKSGKCLTSNASSPASNN